MLCIPEIIMASPIASSLSSLYEHVQATVRPVVPVGTIAPYCTVLFKPPVSLHTCRCLSVSSLQVANWNGTPGLRRSDVQQFNIEN